MNKFRSILAIATVATSITASVLPAQAVTWEELWGAVKQGYERSSQSSQPQPSSGANNEAPTQSAPTQSAPAQSAPAPQQSNYSQQSSTAPQTDSPPPQIVQRLKTNCVKVNGHDPERIERNSAESMISVGRRALPGFLKVRVSDSYPYETTCRIVTHSASDRVRIAYALADNSELEQVSISIYVSGQEKVRRIMSRGQISDIAFNTSGANSYAVVIKSLDGRNGYIHRLPVRQY